MDKTAKRGYTRVLSGAAPDVPYWVNMALEEIAGDVNNVATDATDAAADIRRGLSTTAALTTSNTSALNDLQIFEATTAGRLAQLENAAGFPGAPLSFADAVVAGLVTDPAKATAAAIQAKIAASSLVFDVTKFGAVGDGITNDGPKVQDAITALEAAGGGTLYFPPGKTFWWPTYVVLPRTVQFKAVALGATFIKRTSDVDINYALFCSQSGTSQGYGSGLVGGEWIGGTFRGNFAAEGGSSACAFALHHADRFEIHHASFIEMITTGHIIDLNGCRNIEIHHCKFAGFKSAGGNYTRIEAIQADISQSGSASAPDSASSWDGLPSIRISVHHNEFLPYTKAGTTYPAPNPFGSHAIRENTYYDTLSFTHNYVLDPIVDTVSDFPGALHFVGARGLDVSDNTFEFSVPTATVLLGLYSTDKGVPAYRPVDGSATDNSAVTIAPLTCSSASFRRNRILGLTASGTDIVRAQPATGTGTNVQFKDVAVENNSVQVLSGSGALNFLTAKFGVDLRYGGNDLAGWIRGLNAEDLDGVDFPTVNRMRAPRNDATRLARCLNVSGAFAVKTWDAAGSSLYFTDCTDIEIGRVQAWTKAGLTPVPARAVAFNNCNRFNIGGGNIKAGAGTIGVQAYGTSANGYIDGVIVSGGATTAAKAETTTTNVLIGRAMIAG